MTFSGAGSSSAGGTIASYEWNFGDGSAPVQGVSASHTYSVAGTYSASLKVTDGAGYSDTRSVTITPTSVQPKVYADSITMSLVTVRVGQAYAQAKVAVKDVSGNVISGATVAGTWSGLVSGSATASTTGGVATFNSSSTRKTGSIKFTVTGISAPGYAYDASLNKMTTNAVTK